MRTRVARVTLPPSSRAHSTVAGVSTDRGRIQSTCMPAPTSRALRSSGQKQRKMVPSSSRTRTTSADGTSASSAHRPRSASRARPSTLASVNQPSVRGSAVTVQPARSDADRRVGADVDHLMARSEQLGREVLTARQVEHPRWPGRQPVRELAGGDRRVERPVRELALGTGLAEVARTGGVSMMRCLPSVR